MGQARTPSVDRSIYHLASGTEWPWSAVRCNEVAIPPDVWTLVRGARIRSSIDAVMGYWSGAAQSLYFLPRRLVAGELIRFSSMLARMHKP